MSLSINFNPLTAEAIFTAYLLSFISMLILSKNRKLEHIGKIKYPLLILGSLLNMVSYIFLAKIHTLLVVLWYAIVGLPAFYLYYSMFACLKNELREKWER